MDGKGRTATCAVVLSNLFVEPARAIIVPGVSASARKDERHESTTF